MSLAQAAPAGIAPETPPLRVRAAADGDAAAWDRFVEAQPDATFFHRFGWRRVFRAGLGLDPRFLIAERGGAIAGVLPLVYQNSLLFGRALSSAPFCAEGGPLAEDEAARQALDEAAIGLARQLKAGSLELRSRRALRPEWTARRGLYATFARPLSAEDGDNLKAIPRKQRAVVRKALKSGLASGEDESLDAFFAVYARSVRNLGTPVFPRRYFRALCESFGADCDLTVIRERGEAVSAVMNFYFRDTVLPYYGGGTEAARRNGANDFLYWEVMRRAAARGCRRFDFGRSKAGTGAFAFKKNWGFEPDWLEYEYWLPPGAALPEKNPNNPKYARLIAAWKRLPLPLANLIGPYLVRGLG